METLANTIEKTGASPIKIYAVTRDLLAAHREKYQLNWKEFIEWFKSASQKFAPSVNFTQKVFQNNKIGNLIIRQAFDNDLLEGSSESDYAYFFLESLYAKAIKESFESEGHYSFESKESNDFLAILNQAGNDESSILVEYSKTDAWFDWKTTHQQYKEFKLEVETELKQHQ